MKKNIIPNISMANIAIYVKGDKVGDALLKYPAIRAFKQALPAKSKIIWITGNESSAFLDRLDFLSKDIIHGFCIKNDTCSISERKDILKKHHVDCLINSEARLLTSVILRKSYDGQYICPALNYFFSDRKPKIRKKNESVFEKFCTLLALAAGQNLNLNFNIDIPKSYKSYVKKILPKTRYIGFSPGASEVEKTWPINHFIKLANLSHKYFFEPVFFLGPNENHLKSRLTTEVPNCKIIPNNNLPTDINNIPLLTIAAANKLLFSVANDSGGGHLLASGRKPIITIFGKNRAQKFLSPYCDQTSINTLDFGKKNVVDLGFNPVYDEFIKMLNREAA